MREEAEVADINIKYEKINQIGSGKYSTVFLCRLNNDESDDYFAMKIIDKNTLTKKERLFL